MTLGETMEKRPAVIPIALVESKHKRNTSGVSNRRDLSSVPPTIKGRRTNTLTTKDIFHKRGVHDPNIGTGACLDIDTEEIVIGVLEEVVFGPESKVVVDSLPRTLRDRKTGPLTTSGENKKDTIKDVRKREGTRSPNRRRKRRMEA